MLSGEPAIAAGAGQGDHTGQAAEAGQSRARHRGGRRQPRGGAHQTAAQGRD